MLGIVDRINKIADNSNLSLDTKVTTAKLEATGICGMGCRFCYNSIMTKYNIRQQYLMPKKFDLMLAALRELGTITEVGMFYMGESAFHPLLSGMYKALKRDGYFTYLTTSWGVIMRQSLHDTLEYLDSLKVSWNYKSEEDFLLKHPTRTAEIYRMLQQAIRDLYEDCKKANKTLAISTVLDVGETPEDYQAALSELAYDENYFLPVQSQGGTYQPGKDGVVGQYTKQSSPLPCWSLFKGFYVDCEMNVRTCCYGHTKSHILMNLEKEKFTKEKYYERKRQFMQDHLNNIIPTMCKQCLS